MQKDVLATIKNQHTGFSKSQKRIAHYILEHYELAAYMTAAKLGEEVGVSESTVVRFAMELGYEGYPQFQKDLQVLIQKKLTAPQRMAVAAKQYQDADLLEKIFQSDIHNLRTSLTNISRADFNSAVHSILKARKVYVLGIRSMKALSDFLCFYLNLMMVDVVHVGSENNAGMYESLMRIGEEDVLFAISFPRYAVVTYNAVNFAKSRGAQVIALTDSPDSPIAQHAAEVLAAKSNMVSFADSLVAAMSILNALIVAIGMEKKEELEHTLSQLENVWEVYGTYEKEYSDS